MDTVIEKLSRQMPDLTPQLQRAAATILDNPGAVAVHSMRTLASEAKVSPPTMVRLARHLGFSGYEEFRDLFRSRVAEIGYGDRADTLRRAADQSGIAALVDRTAAAAEQGLHRFHEPGFAADIERAAEIIAAAKKSYVIASGASFGQAVSFHYVSRMAMPNLEIANGLGIRSVDELTAVSDEDAVIVISTRPYATTTVQAGLFAYERGAQVVAVTDRRTSPLARIAKAVVAIETESPHYFPSMTSLNAALEALSAAIAVKLGKDAVQAISNYEKALDLTGYYWAGDE